MSTVAEFVAELRKILEEQREQFRASVLLTKRQREALLARDLSRLERLTGEEQALGQVLRQLESKRKTAWSRVAVAVAIPETELDWQKIESHISAQEAEQLSQLLTELNDLLRGLVTENASNLHILRRKVEVSEFTLRVAGQAPAGVYGPDGRRETPTAGRRLDRTA